MTIILWIIIFIASIALLIKSSDYFTDSAERIGIRMGMPAFLVGVTIVAIGTSLPELITSIISVAKHTSEFVAGNVIGSNITNIFLIIGITSILVKKMTISYEITKIDLPILMASAFIFAIVAYNGNISFIESVILISVAVIYLIYIADLQNKNKKKKEEEIKKNIEKETKIKKYKLIEDLAILSLSSILIYFGAKYTVESVINISNVLKIGKEIIASSVVALGTSLPELTVSINAAKKGKSELALGNILGSNIFNVSAVVGISGLFGTLIIPTNMLLFGLPMMLVATLLYFFIIQDKEITQWEGWILIILYMLFIGNIFGLL